MDFTKKGLNQMIFSKKTVNASAGKNSSAFKAILADKNISKVIKKSGEKKVFYDALRKRGLAADGHGITRNVLKKVLGDIEKSTEFSHHEMMELRKHLVGGPISSSITREYKKYSTAESNNPGKPKVNMREIYNEIMSKRRRGALAQAQDSVRENSNMLNSPNFLMSNRNIRAAQDFVHSSQINSDNKFAHQHSDNVIKEKENEVKDMLKRIQS